MKSQNPSEPTSWITRTIPFLILLLGNRVVIKTGSIPRFPIWVLNLILL